MDLQQEIKNIIPDDNEHIFGYADLQNLLHEKYEGFNQAIVVGKKLDDRIIDSIKFGPNIDYYNHYCRINDYLFQLCANISKFLNSKNIQNMIINPTDSDDEIDSEYYKTLRCDFSHKMAATRAGLGWVGKTDLFISKEYGPRVRLSTVLINYHFNSLSLPVSESNCGSCILCVESCPAQAANGKLWNVNIDRDEFFDAFKCREKCRELSRENMKKDESICGICISVCPVGRSIE